MATKTIPQLTAFTGTVPATVLFEISSSGSFKLTGTQLQAFVLNTEVNGSISLTTVGGGDINLSADNGINISGNAIGMADSGAGVTISSSTILQLNGNSGINIDSSANDEDTTISTGAGNLNLNCSVITLGGVPTFTGTTPGGTFTNGICTSFP